MALARHHSNHTPLVLSFRLFQHAGPIPFMFLSMWSSQDSFIPAVKKAWNVQVLGNPMARVILKHKNVKKALAVWHAGSAHLQQI